MPNFSEFSKTVMDSPIYSKVSSHTRASVTQTLIENQMGVMPVQNSRALVESMTNSNLNENAPTTQTSGIASWDPIVISAIRRAVPQLMAFDVAGVQPLTQPSGLITALRPRYNDQKGPEAWVNEPNSAHSGTGDQAGDTSGFNAEFAVGSGMATQAGEGLGGTGKDGIAEMSFTLDKLNLATKTRKIQAQFTREVQEDSRAQHGIDVRTELSGLLASELVAEMDRELLRKVNYSAVMGAQHGTAKFGEYDLKLDADGRNLKERFQALLFQIELEANEVMKATRRGRANTIIASANVVSALSMVGLLDYSPSLVNDLDADFLKSTFAGTLMGKYRVLIDPYANVDYITVAYKGSNNWDAGIYFAPYIPMELMEAVDPDTYDPKIAFRTRYAIAANPFAATEVGGAIKAGQGLGSGENFYFRKFRVIGIGGK